MKRLPLSRRVLPDYTRGDEIANMVTHIVGGSLGIFVLLLCLWRCIPAGSAAGIVGVSIYGGSMILLYAVSSVYHGLRPSMGKLVMQVIDHCTIYFLIVGTYTPILLIGFIPRFPVIGWALLGMEWALGILAATLTAIDLKKHNVFSMICYILMGWGIVFFLKQTITVFTLKGFYLLLAGGLVYTVGAVLYGIGSKKPWVHSLFHGFVVVGSLLQFLSIFLYLL